MHRKLVFGWILLIAGIILQVVSDAFDIWLVDVLGGILWPVGLVMGVNASIFLDHKKQKNDSTTPPTDKEKK